MSGGWTKGPWSAAACDSGGDCEWGIDSHDGYHIAVACGGMEGATEANARLIAEAGTVANETGLSPRQLADQRAELLVSLEWVRDNKIAHPANVQEVVRLAIANATGVPS